MPTKTPRISVVMPAYNSEKYIAEAIESILNQTFSDFEFIIVNDCSTDKTPEIIEKYAKLDERIIVINNKKNYGTVYSKNTGIHKAKAEYIYTFDSDDIINKTLLEKQYKAIISKRGDIITCRVKYFGERDGEMRLKKITKFNMCAENTLINAALFKKSDFLECGGYSDDCKTCLEDYDLWLNMMFKFNKKFYRINEILYYYRIKPKTESRDSASSNLHEITINNFYIKYPEMNFYRFLHKAKFKIKRFFFRIQDNRIKIFKIPVYKLKHNRIRISDNVQSTFLSSYYATDNDRNFVQIANDNIKPSSSDPLILAYYLTQFHETEINNKNFGKGFTEWTNVAKAKQLYTGHYQPHIPIDMGFYNLAHDDVMSRQVELAKKYGIGGFCFYYYWFSGQRILEKPLFNYLNNKTLDLPFCLFWANETWQRRWFGGNKEILIEHKFDISMVKKFFDDILPFFKDKRYIKIDNKPLLILYHYNEFQPDDLQEIVQAFNKLALKAGFDGIHFIGQGYKLPSQIVQNYALDGVAEFSPCGMELPIYQEPNLACPEYTGTMYDAASMVKNKTWQYDTDYLLYKGVFTSWDNTPRTFTRANIYRGMTPQLYKEWLKETIEWTKKRNNKQNRIIFVNAWNEWGEGAHLEPDLKYGYAYLQATRDAIEESRGKK